MYTRRQAARAYALGASRVLGDSSKYFDREPALIPVFVANLFQALEIAMKATAFETGVFTGDRLPNGAAGRNGHDIEQLNQTIDKELELPDQDMCLQAFDQCLNDPTQSAIVREMVKGSRFSKTRAAYVDRTLGYAELKEGELEVVQGVKSWSDTLEALTKNLDPAVSVLRQWKSSDSSAEVGAIWYR